MYTEVYIFSLFLDLCSDTVVIFHRTKTDVMMMRKCLY